MEEKPRKLSRYEWISGNIREFKMKIRVFDNGIKIESETDFEREFLDYNFSGGIEVKYDRGKKLRSIIISKEANEANFNLDLPAPPAPDVDLPF